MKKVVIALPVQIAISEIIFSGLVKTQTYLTIVLIKNITINMIQNTNSIKKNLRWYMRYLHNKTGFFISGLVIIYSLSGLIQTYRDTNLLKHDVVNEK